MIIITTMAIATRTMIATTIAVTCSIRKNTYYPPFLRELCAFVMGDIWLVYTMKSIRYGAHKHLPRQPGTLESQQNPS